jgi:signal peptidase I
MLGRARGAPSWRRNKVADQFSQTAVEPVAGPDGQPEEQPKTPWWREVIDLVVAFVVMLAVLFLVRTFVVEPFQIPSGSMLQTIQIGDRVFAEKISVALNDMPEQGEIVTFTNPRDASETLIKRVIAVAGQTVDFIDGVVYVDGEPLDEPYAVGETYPMNSDSKFLGYQITYPFTVPEGCFWAMGDNRENSSDSRVFGPVDASTITGHAVFRYWPIARQSDDGSWELSLGPLD